MTGQQETIRITANESDLTISIEGGGADLTFDAIAPITNETNRMSMDLCRLIPGDAKNQYVLTFEFDRDDDSARGRRKLKRLEAHVRDIAVKIRDNGYVLEGVLIGWIGYTDIRRAQH